MARDYDSRNFPESGSEAHRAVRRAALHQLYTETLEQAEHHEQAARGLLALDGDIVLNPESCRASLRRDEMGRTAWHHYNASVGGHVFALELATWLDQTPVRPVHQRPIPA